MERSFARLQEELQRLCALQQQNGTPIQNIHLHITVIQDSGTAVTVLPQGGVSVVSTSAVPVKKTGGIISQFIEAAMKQAEIEVLSDGKFYAEIPSCRGVWADGDSKEECLSTLQEVLEEWILFKLRDGDKDFPVLNDADLNSDWAEDNSWGG